MKRMKVLYASFLVAVMLLAVSACGVSSVTEPTATADPVSASSIQNSGAIVITFNVAMDSKTLVLSGDMASESDGGVWSNTGVNNGRLKISPSADSNDTWAAGERTLNIKVSSSSGAPLSLNLTYTVVAAIPTAVVIPASPATINGDSVITVLFSTSMSIPTLALSGDMAAEADSAVVWSKSNNENDTLVIQPSSAWSGDATTLVVNVDSAEGAPLASLALIYAVDVSIPVIAGESPSSNTTIDGNMTITIPFNIAMRRGTLALSGTLVGGGASDGGIWSSTNNTDDTLTISPNGVWTDSAGATRSITIDVEASNGNLLIETLNYIVDTTFLINSVTPSTNSNITGNQPIIIDFGESADIATLVASGTLWDGSNGGSWSDNDSKLTLLPKTPPGAWLVGPINLTLDILDLLGNSLDPLSLDYLVDKGTPVITLVGIDPFNVTVGDSYTDAGATATDDVDNNSDITGNIVVAGDTVDVNTIGVYVITYNVSDAAGNLALQVSRTVNVIDTTPPVIVLSGVTPFNLNVGDTYVEGGATANDDIDGDISSSIIIDSSAVNMAAVGSYTVTYNVSDAALNAAAEVTRTVIVSDGGAPVITLLGATTVNLTVGDSYTDAGATANDNVDGDITSSITIVNSVNMAAVGSYTVTYNVSDAASNAAVEVIRTVIVSDGDAPVITILGATTVNLSVGDIYTDAGATASDVVDGNLTASIVTVNSVNTAAVGSYTVTYNVSDAANNAAVEITRTVNVTDGGAPVITLVGAATVNLNAGDSYTDAGATASDNVDGVITSSIVTVNPVNAAVPGTYTVTYNVSDAALNAAAEVTRTVIVSNGDAPVITLLGAATVNLTLGESYTDAGATASDNIDGDITANIVTVNPVDITTTGTYTVTYNVQDAALNSAVEVTRTVNVIN